MSSKNCQICEKEVFKYTCPRCNIAYCSVSCYKSPLHLTCSEQFYKQCIQDEITSAADDNVSNKDDMRKIYDILRRIREYDAGLKNRTFSEDDLDSDDEENVCMYDKRKQYYASFEQEDDNDDNDIVDRLKNIDINDPNKVWECLSLAEQEEFKELVASGEIMKLIPEFQPWWLKTDCSKIVDLSDNTQQHQNMPNIVNNIPEYSTLCSKEPAPCLHYNLWNILAAYSSTVRFFNGEHITSPNEATAYLINLSLTLKCGTNFEDVEDAVISVEMEALTTGNGASELLPTSGAPKSLFIESRSQLQSDARQLMRTRTNKLLALSDILQLLQLTKKILKVPNKSEAEFQKLFAFASGMEELTLSKIQRLIKKLKFYLSYTNRTYKI